LLALIASGVVGYTGKLGGKIRHTEFHGGAQVDRGEEATEEAQETREGERGKNRRGVGGKGKLRVRHPDMTLNNLLTISEEAPGRRGLPYRIRK
jgi:hypothetical protein